MMIGCFGVKADGIHEHQRGGPAIVFIRAAQRAALVPPARQRFQLFGDLGIGVGGFLGHGGSPQSQRFAVNRRLPEVLLHLELDRTQTGGADTREARAASVR